MKERYESFYNKIVKRYLDFILAFGFIVLLSPVLIVISLINLIASGKPIIYKADRSAYNGGKFKIYKFRTMMKNADKIGGGTTSFNDPRITKVGKILRKTKLDELPQLFNILKGEMSFIGPRPELLKYTDMYSAEEKIILKVRPGLSDYSSLKFINLDEVVGESNADDVFEQKVLPHKNVLRIKYAKEVSFLVDAKIFLLTIANVFKKMITEIFR